MSLYSCHYIQILQIRWIVIGDKKSWGTVVRRQCFIHAETTAELPPKMGSSVVLPSITIVVLDVTLLG